MSQYGQCDICGHKFTDAEEDNGDIFQTALCGDICLECKEKGDFHSVAPEQDEWNEKYLSAKERKRLKVRSDQDDDEEGEDEGGDENGEHGSLFAESAESIPAETEAPAPIAATSAAAKPQWASEFSEDYGVPAWLGVLIKEGKCTDESWHHDEQPRFIFERAELDFRVNLSVAHINPLLRLKEEDGSPIPRFSLWTEVPNPENSEARRHDDWMEASEIGYPSFFTESEHEAQEFLRHRNLI